MRSDIYVRSCGIFLEGKNHSDSEIPGPGDDAAKSIAILDDNIGKYADTSDLEVITQDIHNDIVRRRQEHSRKILEIIENGEDLKQTSTTRSYESG